MQRPLPIGIFDSGVGGLTVAAALRARLPTHDLLYLGDTARLPYGTKSPETVTRYALRASAHLVQMGVSMLVVACNTASAHALTALTRQFAHIPVLGVVEAGANIAASQSPGGRIAIAATEGTCRSGAFERAILAKRPTARVSSIACPMFVALAEEGLTQGDIALALAHHYLDSTFTADDRPDTLVLGCTHFPLLKQCLGQVLGPDVGLVDCATAVAQQAYHTLGSPQAHGHGGRLRILATDAPDRVGAAAGRFFPAIGPHPAVELINI